MYTTLDTIDAVYSLQNTDVRNNIEISYSERIDALNKMYAYLKDPVNEAKLNDAIYKDFKKPKTEVVLSEYLQVISHIKYIKKHLKSWMKPQKIRNSIAMTGLRCEVIHESKGQVLIIAPWNYPFFLAINPLLYAIAAGCRVILKPSELTSHTSQYMEEMISNLYDKNKVFVAQGAVEETTHLLDKKWNHIFFTGSPRVGKIVMKAASKYLASVTLELGGKSPCIIDESADIKQSVNRLLWGKMVNAGQTCIAPDYVLVSDNVKEQFLKECTLNINQKFGEDPEKSDSFARVISTKHTARLKELIDDAKDKGAKIVHGGNVNIEDRYISPTIITDVNHDMTIMEEEIFGPILPILSYSKLEDAIELINSKTRPLSLYICSKNQKNIQEIKDRTTSGGVVINEFLMGAAFPEVPFGGINTSGIGKSFGKNGFIEFTNEKPLIKRSFLTLDMMYPPYTQKKEKTLGWFKKIMG